MQLSFLTKMVIYKLALLVISEICQVLLKYFSAKNVSSCMG